jgi:MFS family permease
LPVDRVKIAEAGCTPAPQPALLKAPREPDVSFSTILMLAAACGFIVANIYYAQPLIAEIARSLGLAPAAAGLIVTMSQIGYGAGLFFIVPLGDLVENRRLILTSIAISAVALAGAAFAPSAAVFLACAGLIGLGSVAVKAAPNDMARGLRALRGGHGGACRGPVARFADTRAADQDDLPRTHELDGSSG